MVTIQTFIVEARQKPTVKENVGPVTYRDIPIEGEVFALPGRKGKFVRRSLHVQPPPMEVYLEAIPER
jgi:hypothetical protein